MIRVPEIILERVVASVGTGEGFSELAARTVSDLPTEGIGGVVAATFSNPERFPSLAVRLAARLGLPPETPAFDVQMACSAYPYALYLAGRLAADTGRRVLLVDGDAQLPLVDAADPATGAIFSDAMTATLLRAGGGAASEFSFLSRSDEALQCPAEGPIRMDGFKVFSFVATEVSKFLRGFLGEIAAEAGEDFLFVPHQANPYMIRQLARSLGLEGRLLVLDEALKNPGSCSVPLTLATHPDEARGRVLLLAGFGAGYSAAAGLVRADDAFEGKVV